MAQPTFIIAEAGVNHNGKLRTALDLVDAAADAGADAVKFQTFSADRLTRRGAEKADYQKSATGEGDQYSMLKTLEMNVEMHERVFLRCQERNIEFMSTAFDQESFDYLISLGIRKAKIPSGEITNHVFLQHIARSGMPIILSTGMSDLGEVRDAIGVITQSSKSKPTLTVLHCTSNYPALPQDVNLRAISTMSREFGLPMGYSDHTLGIGASIAAVALGAEIIEKHFTLDKSSAGPDHRASLESHELRAMIKEIRAVEASLGDGIKVPRLSELPVRELVRKSVTTLRSLSKGEVIDDKSLILLRPGNGIPAFELDHVKGRRVVRNIDVGETLQWSDLE